MTASDITTARVRDERVLVVAAVLTSVTVWASAFVGIRAAGRDFAPGPLALGRLLVGTLALGALVLVRRERLPQRRALAATVVCGVLWFGLYNLALNAAEQRVDAGIAAMLVNLGPILIAVLAGVVLGEGFPPRLLTGCVVSFTGAALIGLAISHHGVAATWGAVLCVVAAFAYAGGVVAQKPALRTSSALSVTWLACTVGAVSLIPYAPSLLGELGTARGSAIVWTVYLGLVPTAIGFVTWAYALSRSTAGKMGTTTYLVPPLAVLLGWAMLAEVPPLLAIPGGALCLAGVALSRSRRSSGSDERGEVAEPSLSVR